MLVIANDDQGNSHEWPLAIISRTGNQTLQVNPVVQIHYITTEATHVQLFFFGYVQKQLERERERERVSHAPKADGVIKLEYYEK